MKRIDGRKVNELRNITIKKGFMKNADGSCLIECGNTKVICTATIEDRVPPFLRGKGTGWLSAEYGMLPASCSHRIQRDASKGKVNGRTHEIQRLIGRSLRAVVDLKVLGERTIWLDCDVLQGDGGTRTASITGAFVAVAHLLERKSKELKLPKNIIKDYVAAISVGIKGQSVLLDICYEEDSTADVDMNVVMTGNGNIVEVQGTAEGEPFSKEQLDKLYKSASKGIKQLVAMQKKCVKI